MEKNACDLHTHSTFSDGTWTPAKIVRRAKEIGLGAVALTDHNTALGLPEFMEAGRAENMRTIAGTELSTTYNGHEVHIVGLFIPEEHWADVNEFTSSLWRAKDESNRKLGAALTAAGYPVDYEAMLAAAPGGQINRSGFGDELARRGYMSKKEAFHTVLQPKERGGLYEAPERPDALRAVEFLRSIGAVPILAHPFLNFPNRDELREFLRLAKERGLAGMEVYYSTFSPDETREALRIASEEGLAASGGSDFHGAAKRGTYLGTGRGTLSVPPDTADWLLNAVGAGRRENM